MLSLRALMAYAIAPLRERHPKAQAILVDVDAFGPRATVLLPVERRRRLSPDVDIETEAEVYRWHRGRWWPQGPGEGVSGGPVSRRGLSAARAPARCVRVCPSLATGVAGAVFFGAVGSLLANLVTGSRIGLARQPPPPLPAP